MGRLIGPRHVTYMENAAPATRSFPKLLFFGFLVSISHALAYTYLYTVRVQSTHLHRCLQLITITVANVLNVFFYL